MARDDETEAYNKAQYLNNCLTPIFLTALVLEAASFYFYTNKATIISIHKRLSPCVCVSLKDKNISFVKFFIPPWMK